MCKTRHPVDALGNRINIGDTILCFYIRGRTSIGNEIKVVDEIGYYEKLFTFLIKAHCIDHEPNNKDSRLRQMNNIVVINKIVNG